LISLLRWPSRHRNQNAIPELIRDALDAFFGMSKEKVYYGKRVSEIGKKEMYELYKEVLLGGIKMSKRSIK
jgi:hypothetical protein